MSIAQRLKQARVAKGLSRPDVMEKIGCSRQSLCNWEGDNKAQQSVPEYATLVQLAQLYEVDPAWLMYGEKNRTVSLSPTDLWNLLSAYNVLWSLTKFR